MLVSKKKSEYEGHTLKIFSVGLKGTIGSFYFISNSLLATVFSYCYHTFFFFFKSLFISATTQIKGRDMFWLEAIFQDIA